MGTEQFDESRFLANDFVENWNYIRHLEEIRLKQVNVYLLVYGGVLSIIAFLMKQPESVPPRLTLSETVAMLQPVLVVAFGFLFLYGIFVGLFLANQKRSYEHYRDVNAAIRQRLACKSANDVPFETTKRRRTHVQKPLRSSFVSSLLLVVIMNTAALGIGLGVLAWRGDAGWVVISVTAAVVSFIVQSWCFTRLSTPSVKAATEAETQGRLRSRRSRGRNL